MTTPSYRKGAHRRKRPEQQLQIAVADFLRLATKPPTYWTAIDHGVGKLGKAEAGLRKARGVKAGIADVLVMHPAGNNGRQCITRVVWIELKVGDGGQSLGQEVFQWAADQCGCMYYIARSVDEVEGFLKGVGIPLHATVRASGVCSSSDGRCLRASRSGENCGPRSAQ